MPGAADVTTGAGLRAVPATDGVYGLPAMTRLDRLPLLQLHTAAAGDSSRDRDTAGPGPGNNDANNFLYVRGGEKVMLDQKGPGTVYRIWVTGFNAATDWIKVYFDGAATPW